MKKQLKYICCNGIEIDYKIKFIEIGLDLDHIYFLAQSIPSISL